jgi:hypothetical protein
MRRVSPSMSLDPVTGEVAELEPYNAAMVHSDRRQQGRNLRGCRTVVHLRPMKERFCCAECD